MRLIDVAFHRIPCPSVDTASVDTSGQRPEARRQPGAWKTNRFCSADLKLRFDEPFWGSVFQCVSISIHRSSLLYKQLFISDKYKHVSVLIVNLHCRSDKHTVIGFWK